MILFAISSATLLGLLFGLLAVATMPAGPEKIIQQRLAAIPLDAAWTKDEGAQNKQVLKEEEEIRTGGLHWLLMRFAGAEILQRWITQGGGKETPSSVFLLSAALAAAGCFLVHIFAPFLPLDLGGAAILGMLPSIYIFWRRSRRIAAFSAALPDAIDMMARALRAGHSMAAAMEIVSQDASGTVASEFGEVFHQQNFGLPLRDSLLQMLDRVPSQDLRVLVTAIILQRETGGNLVELLDRTAFMIRDRIRLRNEIRTHTAQGRMTGWVLCALPVVMMILINIVNPGYSNVLFVDPFGRKLIYFGVGLLTLGAITIHRIVNSVEL